MHTRVKPIKLLTFTMMSVLLLSITAGCMGDSHSETFVIPETEGQQPASEASVGQAFEVKTIYPLPVSSAEEMQVLGWTNGEAVVGHFKANVTATAAPNGLQLLAPPYEKPKLIASTANIDIRLLGLSPDGKRIAGLSESGDGISMTLVPVQGNQIKQIAAPADIQRKMLSRTIQWSNNSRYISYLVAGDGRGQLDIVIYDTVDGKAKLHPLINYSTDNNSATVVLSDDGNRILVDDGKLVTMAKRNEDGSFSVQYDHPSGMAISNWVDASRFMFLGADGTLFQYDARNGELSVLLEKVGSFSLSPDRKVIAYTQTNTQAIHVGKLQGNNVLYQTVVYQGIVPSQMKWSLKGGSLLVDKSNPSAAVAQEISPAPVAGQDRLQTFVIQFRS
ncbi:hypothetical protein M3194_13210 [Paenibacillus glycanilyticus]|uniref:hypothetical protein n=1 Tax=Paenibacillus glycanilyticus TaxID=126569 RepID=UPI00203B1C93|nr:hypothetical protein [Paenibacillus glycanilyticus]MCM3628325.1 hypothetical protein [Paenibacillus glycanilyticus]